MLHSVNRRLYRLGGPCVVSAPTRPVGVIPWTFPLFLPHDLDAIYAISGSHVDFVVFAATAFTLDSRKTSRSCCLIVRRLFRHCYRGDVEVRTNHGPYSLISSSIDLPSRIMSPDARASSIASIASSRSSGVKSSSSHSDSPSYSA